MSVCAFSPDGASLATIGNDHTRLWDVATGAQVQAMTRGETLAFSPDGARLATGALPSAWVLSDVATGTYLDTLSPLYGEPVACAFSPDGTLLATVNWTPNHMERDPASGQYVEVVRDLDDPEAVAVRLWDPATAKELRTLLGHTGGVRGCAFSPDGSLLATTSDDHTTRLWDPATGTEIRTVTGHTSYVRGCAFSPDGSLLATVSDDHTRLWDPATGSEIRTLTGPAMDCAFSPDGSLLAATTRNWTVQLWDPASGTAVRTLTAEAVGCAFSPDGSLLATRAPYPMVQLWDPASGTEIRTLTVHVGDVPEAHPFVDPFPVSATEHWDDHAASADALTSWVARYEEEYMSPQLLDDFHSRLDAAAYLLMQRGGQAALLAVFSRVEPTCQGRIRERWAFLGFRLPPR